ncbi:hypothetical protein [Chryseobacterium profundimaris]|uniref:Ubiquitin-like domain-containing protein n=1 Tax=Chryseobacterium profundimaris TaxID=1387275 RepID=A0ABY1NGH0_9FLAO|nr:hypothetical protein [Chryseobacterium profundimaris]SMP09051.1 hypothetical protein SAMN06264346_10222 [Chryseobacterium profundimaris]
MDIRIIIKIVADDQNIYTFVKTSNQIFMTKTVYLRAFRIENSDISQRTVNVKELLEAKMESTTVDARRMLLNNNDNEEDLICDYELSNHFVFAAILRIKPRGDVPNIPDNLFNDNRFLISELDELEIDSSLVYKDHYYFFMNNEYLVTNLSRNTNITRLQTYINHLLEDERDGTLYEFTPLIQEAPEYKLKDLEKIKIQDPNINIIEDSADGEESQTRSLSLSMLTDLLSSVRDIDSHRLDQVVSAELLLKFKKPRDMSSDDYQRVLGAYMKPISDTENVTFYPKKGSPVKGSDILTTKQVDIDLTQSGKLSEQHLKQEMERFLREL